MSAQLTTPREDLGTVRKCCVLEGEHRMQCVHTAQFRVAAEPDTWDDYTEVCADHVDTVLERGDVVVRIADGKRMP